MDIFESSSDGDDDLPECTQEEEGPDEDFKESCAGFEPRPPTERSSTPSGQTVVIRLQMRHREVERERRLGIVTKKRIETATMKAIPLPVKYASTAKKKSGTATQGGLVTDRWKTVSNLTLALVKWNQQIRPSQPRRPSRHASVMRKLSAVPNCRSLSSTRLSPIFGRKKSKIRKSGKNTARGFSDCESIPTDNMSVEKNNQSETDHHKNVTTSTDTKKELKSEAGDAVSSVGSSVSRRDIPPQQQQHQQQHQRKKLKRISIRELPKILPTIRSLNHNKKPPLRDPPVHIASKNNEASKVVCRREVESRRRAADAVIMSERQTSDKAVASSKQGNRSLKKNNDISVVIQRNSVQLQEKGSEVSSLLCDDDCKAQAESDLLLSSAKMLKEWKLREPEVPVQFPEFASSLSESLDKMKDSGCDNHPSNELENVNYQGVRTPNDKILTAGDWIKKIRWGDHTTSLEPQSLIPKLPSLRITSADKPDGDTHQQGLIDCHNLWTDLPLNSSDVRKPHSTYNKQRKALTLREIRKSVETENKGHYAFIENLNRENCDFHDRVEVELKRIKSERREGADRMYKCLLDCTLGKEYYHAIRKAKMLVATEAAKGHEAYTLAENESWFKNYKSRILELATDCRTKVILNVIHFYIGKNVLTESSFTRLVMSVPCECLYSPDVQFTLLHAAHIFGATPELFAQLVKKQKVHNVFPNTTSQMTDIQLMEAALHWRESHPKGESLSNHSVTPPSDSHFGNNRPRKITNSRAFRNKTTCFSKVVGTRSKRL